MATIATKTQAPRHKMMAPPLHAVREIIEWIGEDSARDGLAETPDRVLRALREMTVGYRESPQEILSKVFDEPCDEMILVREIAFASLCEHHLLPFTGFVTLAYIPGKVVGLSKLARLVECFAKRLQIQERMTKQLADAIDEYLEAKGVGVMIKASHACMSCRGVRKAEAEMVTSAIRGVLIDNGPARAEFFSMARC